MSTFVFELTQGFEYEYDESQQGGEVKVDINPDLRVHYLGVWCIYPHWHGKVTLSGKNSNRKVLPATSYNPAWYWTPNGQDHLSEYNNKLPEHTISLFTTKDSRDVPSCYYTMRIPQEKWGTFTDPLTQQVRGRPAEDRTYNLTNQIQWLKIGGEFTSMRFKVTDGHAGSVDVPTFLDGWDPEQTQVPTNFDTSHAENKYALFCCAISHGAMEGGQ
ncbi:MAG: hypothetical protein AAF571_13265 [Verrucomicrobiota bacterium]